MWLRVLGITVFCLSGCATPRGGKPDPELIECRQMYQTLLDDMKLEGSSGQLR